MTDMSCRTCIFGLVLLVGFCRLGGGTARNSAADERGLFWSFQPVRATAPPMVGRADWPRSAIDSFILRKLEEHGLGPSAPADKRTLIRRATIDLTGLPPTPEETESFLSDESPEAFARVVDRLLASPRYGERWGRHWLDVVRYADARDLIQLPAESDFREAWRYRDWVVDSFNRDRPYDEFITQQVAGDLLQPADPAQINSGALVATGMLAIADFVPGDVDKQQMIADYVNDQVDVVGRAFLGLTLACARCHDHKFDPITTEDYYSLAGIFFSTRLIPGPVKGNTPLVRVPLLAPAELATREAAQLRDKVRLAELSQEIATLSDGKYRAYLERRVANDSARYLLAAWEFAHPAAGEERPAVAGFAKARGVEEEPLARCIRYFDEPRPHPAMVALRAARGLAEAKDGVQELSEKLTAIATGQANRACDGSPTGFAKKQLFRFRADDRRLMTNESRHVTLWPNRGRAVANAVPVAELPSPATATVQVLGDERGVLRFTGKELLHVAGSVPPTGTLLVAFRPDPMGGPGQRLLGWEDAAVGQHGIGMMTDGAGGVHCILRRNGMSGDVVVPAPESGTVPPAFQILCITWGPAGVAVYRNGQPVGANKAIDSVSSDPAITALRIGGPGSGSSPSFRGDLAELRVYFMPADDADRMSLEAELTARWWGARADQEPAEVGDLYEELISPLGPFQLDVMGREKLLTGEFGERLAGLRNELEGLQKKNSSSEIPRAVVVQEGGPPGTPHEGFQDAVVYLRGNHLKHGEKVPRGMPKVIAGPEPPVIREGSGRRELARWLASPANPLTARVMVNRLWQHHFGAGLVGTSANFGMMGDRPSHPELLDYLAAQFVSSGWSVKEMHRQIMLSSTYQQSSLSDASLNGNASDPENRLLWRANRRRLEAEALRDSLLTVAGRLDETAGGPGFQTVATPRRSLYLMAVRTGAKAAEFGPLFDAPNCSGIVERRTESVVAAQALFLMNDPVVLEWAKSLAERVTSEAASSDDRLRIHRLYEITLGRPPLESELEVGLRFLSAENDDRWVRYCHLLLCTNEFLYVD
jgi:hypothetical protein